MNFVGTIACSASGIGCSSVISKKLLWVCQLHLFRSSCYQNVIDVAESVGIYLQTGVHCFWQVASADAMPNGKRVKSTMCVDGWYEDYRSISKTLLPQERLAIRSTGFARGYWSTSKAGFSVTL